MAKAWPSNVCGNFNGLVSQNQGLRGSKILITHVIETAGDGKLWCDELTFFNDSGFMMHL